MVNCHVMNITKDKYERLRSMNILNPANYNLNDKVDVIIAEIED